MSNEFYIGWMANAPASFARFVRKYLFIMITLVAGLGMVLAISQKPFATGIFEAGSPVVLEGVYFSSPVPVLKLMTGKNVWGSASFMTILLVGYGKHGAEGIVAEYEKEKGISLNGRFVKLKGTLLYNDGKTILQISAADSAVKETGGPAPKEWLADQKDLGIRELRGEITDPKCYFGVMKPGEGKPHRDCATRCILGGIEPVLVITDDSGLKNYCLVRDAKGGKINESLKPFVGEPVSITGKVEQVDDWLVIYVQSGPAIRTITYREMRLGDADAALCVRSCVR